MFPPFQVRSEPNLWLKMALVVALGAVATLGFALMAHGADAPPMPIADPPKAVLTLDAPKSVPAGSGYFKIRAAAAGPVSFDVEAQFDDQAVVFQSEQLDAATLLVGVPASAGVIRVEAAVAVDGKPPVFAKAFIEVVKKEAPPPDPAKPAGKPVGKLYAVFVVDKSVPGPVLTLAENPAVQKLVEASGDSLTLLDAKSPAIAAQGLTKFIADAGGPPCLIVLDEQGAVHQAVKAPITRDDLMSLLDSIHKGK